MSLRIRIDAEESTVPLETGEMKGVEVSSEIGDDKETDFYPEGIDDADNRE